MNLIIEFKIEPIKIIYIKPEIVPSFSLDGFVLFVSIAG